MFMECKDRTKRSSVMLPHTFLPTMPARKLRVAAHKRRGFPNLAAAVPACIARGRCVAASSFPNAATKDAVRASAASAATKDAVLRPFRENRALKKDPITGESEGLAFEFNLCEAVASWEKVCILCTVLTCDLSCFFSRFATVPQHSQKSTLMHYQMAGRSMHGAGSTKESF
ncbi:uncharacterized protein LOC123398567 [Hordeum vulgare subsp. vulgare]|uniref:uncharacterized protein LOC123398567 n=1 Tax=Hordeum vulgare subsp. vulgare TaxID=112509 RepID=UPI001D1A5708|nr:uncharacterized protein LOC123398567 [Hordeum vulgare subsp. vulgare]